MNKIVLLLILIIPITALSQQISLREMLALQQGRLIAVQDFLDSNSWSLSRTVTVSEADSLFWDYRVKTILDSLRQTKPQQSVSQKELFISNLIKTYSSESPLYLIYYPTIDTSKSKLIVNDFTIRLPNLGLFQSVYFGFDNFWSHHFHQSLEITYKGKDPKEILKQIALLRIPQDSSYVVNQKPTVKRVYMYKNQVITITIFDLDNSSNFERTYSLEVFNKADYLYLNKDELELKGKTDIIQ